MSAKNCVSCYKCGAVVAVCIIMRGAKSTNGELKPIRSKYF